MTLLLRQRTSKRRFNAVMTLQLRLVFARYYRKISNIRRAKSQNLNDSRLVLPLSLPNLLKPVVKSGMKM